MQSDGILLVSARNELIDTVKEAVESLGLRLDVRAKPPKPDMFSRPEGLLIWIWDIENNPPESGVIASYYDAWGGGMPAVVATGAAPAAEQILEMLEAGFDAVLPWPARKEQFARLIASQAAAEKRRFNVARRRFSHILRQPLTVLMGYAELARDRFDKDAKDYYVLDEIDQSGQELMKLLEQTKEHKDNS